MVRRILVPLDGSDPSRAALEYAVEQFPEAELIVLHVLDPVRGGYELGAGIPQSAETWYENARERADELFEEARSVADDHGVTLETEFEVGRPARTIVDRAAADDVDAVVIGSHGRAGVSRILLGSVAETVVRRASVPVTVVR